MQRLRPAGCAAVVGCNGLLPPLCLQRLSPGQPSGAAHAPPPCRQHGGFRHQLGGFRRAVWHAVGCTGRPTSGSEGCVMASHLCPLPILVVCYTRWVDHRSLGGAGVERASRSRHAGLTWHAHALPMSCAHFPLPLLSTSVTPPKAAKPPGPFGTSLARVASAGRPPHVSADCLRRGKSSSGPTAAEPPASSRRRRRNHVVQGRAATVPTRPFGSARTTWASTMAKLERRAWSWALPWSTVPSETGAQAAQQPTCTRPSLAAASPTCRA